MHVNLFIGLALITISISSCMVTRLIFAVIIIPIHFNISRSTMEAHSNLLIARVSLVDIA